MTTATTWRKERGRETERLVAAYLRANGWPYAEPVGAGRPGVDITGTPGLAIEVKATRSVQPVHFLAQAAGYRRPGDPQRPPLPCAIWRPDGSGPAHLTTWPVMIEFAEYVGLLRAAGYGDNGFGPAEGES